MNRLTASLEDVCKFLGKGACGEPEDESFAWEISVKDVQDDEEFPPTHFQQLESEWGVSIARLVSNFNLNQNTF